MSNIRTDYFTISDYHAIANSSNGQSFNASPLIEIMGLKYSKFLAMINELNSIAEYFLDDNGFSLSFSISKGTDQTFLWKLTTRILCSKAKIGETDIKSYRILRLSQFVNIYNYIKQHIEALKVFQPEFQGCSVKEQNTKNALSFSTIEKLSEEKPTTSNSTSENFMTESKLFDIIQSMNDNEEEICCICMESKSNLALNCAHSFCENCMKEWHITSNTCPICRSISEDADCFVLADKPDYFHIQEEISKSLFQITDSSPKHLKRKPPNSNTVANTSRNLFQDEDVD